MRYIRDHAVYGQAVIVKASSEDEARRLACPKGDWSVWEAKEISSGEWEVYVAEHTSCFALDD